MDAGGFAHAGAAVKKEQQQCVVAPTIGAMLIRLGNDRAHVVGFEVGRRFLAGLLRRDRQHPRILQRTGQIIAHQMPEEATEGGAPAIAGGSRVRAVDLDVIEKARDHVGVEIAELQRCDVPAIPLSGEREQEFEGIPVGANRMQAGPALARQIFHEEGFDEREQLPRRGPAHCGGRAPRRCCSNRLLASSSSCGVAFR